jgi:hypothetical protein
MKRQPLRWLPTLARHLELRPLRSASCAFRIALGRVCPWRLSSGGTGSKQALRHRASPSNPPDPMLPLPGLSPVLGKPVMARFDGGQLSSDASVLVLREIEQCLRVAERLAACNARSFVVGLLLFAQRHLG